MWDHQGMTFNGVLGPWPLLFLSASGSPWGEQLCLATCFLPRCAVSPQTQHDGVTWLWIETSQVSQENFILAWGDGCPMFVSVKRAWLMQRTGTEKCGHWQRALETSEIVLWRNLEKLSEATRESLECRVEPNKQSSWSLKTNLQGWRQRRPSVVRIQVGLGTVGIGLDAILTSSLSAFLHTSRLCGRLSLTKKDDLV